jgi:hypothetical protein
MPFFMFLSGIVFQMTFQPGIAATRSYLSTRAIRLLPAFFCLAALIWVAKMIGRDLVHVDNVQGGDLSELAAVLFRPSESIATSLWYIYVLFELYVLFTLSITVSRGRLVPVLIGAAVLHALFQTTEVTALFGASLVCEFALFFAFGTIFAKHYQTLSKVAKDNALLTYVIFASSFVVLLLIPHPLTELVIGTCSLPALFVFASSFQSSRDRAILLLLAQYSFTIYLLNTLFIGLTKGVMLEFLSWDGHNFLLFLPVLLVAGICGPIALHRVVLSRAPVVARFTK